MKEKLPLILRILFLSLSCFHIFSLAGDNISAMIISKSLIMPFLAILYFVLAKQSANHKLDFFILVALFFSWLGDIALIKGHADTQFFIYGLVAFLIAHIFYIISFYKDMSRTSKVSLIVAQPHYALPIVVITIVFIYILIPGLGDMKYPVMGYATIISLMVLFAINRWEKVSKASFYLVLFGAFSFFISDSMIAINKFHTPFELQRFAIMSTYIFGQWLIVEGILKRNN